MKSFPILARQWDSIHPFKETILKNCREFLKEAPDDVDRTVAALASILLLEDVTVRDVFETFLEVKRQAVVDLFADEATDSTFKAKVCNLVQLVTRTMRQIYFVFGGGSAAAAAATAAAGGDPEAGASSSPANSPDRLIVFAQTALSTSIGDDASLERLSGSHFLAQTMPKSIRDFKPSLASPLTALEAMELKELSQKWLEDVTSITHDSCLKLARFVNNVPGLMRARDAVWNLLKEEYQVEVVERKASELFSESGTAWNWLCKETVGMDVELWKQLLQQIFLQRSQTVLTGMFRLAGESALQRVQESVAAATAAANCADGAEFAESNMVQLLWGQMDGSSRPAPSGGSAIATGLALCTPNVVSVIATLNESLATLLDDANLLLQEGSADSAAALPARNGLGKAFPFDKLGDAVEMKRFLQAACEKCVDDLIVGIKAEEKVLLARPADAATTDQILFLGRTCRAVGQFCDGIPTLVMLPSTNKSTVSAARKRRSNVRRAEPTEHEQRLAAVKTKLVETCSEFHSVWAERFAATHAAAFRGRLLGRDWQYIALEKRTWQEHTVEEETETGEKVKSVIRLPSQPSGFVLSLLCAICAEINRVGGHTVELNILRNLAKQIFHLCIAAYEDLLTGSAVGAAGLALGQDGSLQVLFDISFIGDVLVGPASADTGSGELHARMSKAIARSKENVDPFDLVLFLPLIETSRSKLYHRCATLLGYLTQLHPAYGGARPTLSSSERSNTMPMADVAPRFPLLPIGSTAVRAPLVRQKRPPVRGAALFAL